MGFYPANRVNVNRLLETYFLTQVSWVFCNTQSIHLLVVAMEVSEKHPKCCSEIEFFIREFRILKCSSMLWTIQINHNGEPDCGCFSFFFLQNIQTQTPNILLPLRKDKQERKTQLLLPLWKWRREPSYVPNGHLPMGTAWLGACVSPFHTFLCPWPPEWPETHISHSSFQNSVGVDVPYQRSNGLWVLEESLFQHV